MEHDDELALPVVISPMWRPLKKTQLGGPHIPTLHYTFVNHIWFRYKGATEQEVDPCYGNGPFFWYYIHISKPYIIILINSKLCYYLWGASVSI